MQLDYSNVYHVIYVGNKKINAIKALREYTGLTLKSAKDIIEYSGGFTMPQKVLAKMMLEYNSYNEECTNADWILISKDLFPPIKL